MAGKNGKYHIEFEYRNAGQGLFYTGIIESQTSAQKYSLVYDCGTDSKQSYIKKAIEKFSSEIDNGPLDLLIISHFDRDHVNMIGHLLSKVGDIKRVILPYLSPEEIIITYYKAIEAGVQETDVFQLILDPVSFFNDYGNPEIIFLHPSDDKDGQEPEGNSNNEGFGFRNSLLNNPNIKNPKNVKHCYTDGFVSIGTLWKFKFFLRDKPKDKLNQFKEKLKDKFKFDSIDVKKLLKDDASIKEVKIIYKSVFGDKGMNDTSLVVHHHKYSNLESFLCVESSFCEWERLIDTNSYTHHLLTGDITFDSDCFTDMKQKWPDIATHHFISFQIPHHGAETAIHFSVLRAFKNVEYWVINFGLGNSHGHPNGNLLQRMDRYVKPEQIALNHQYKCFKVSTCVYK